MSSSDADSPSDPADWPTLPTLPKPNLDAVVTQLSKELEWMGLSAISCPSIEDNGADDALLGLVIGAAYELIGAIRQLQHSKRQRDDHAQQLVHDLQRCQWLLDRQKEQCVQREREAAEAREKQRRSEERSRQLEAALKKKTEQHRQLLRETQLKDNQWQHAMRRKDIEIERLQQQLVKLLSAKQHGVALAPIEIDVRGSLAATGASTSAGRRKRWDRVDESRNHRAIEDKWKLVVGGLENEIQTLRSDYQTLIDMAGTFFEKIARTKQREIPQNVKEWVQLPLSLIGTQLEALFKALGENWIVKGEFCESHESLKHGTSVRHEAGLERWTHSDTPDTDWLFNLAKDNSSVFSVHDFSETAELLKFSTHSCPPIQNSYCCDDEVNDDKQTKRETSPVASLKDVGLLDTPWPSAGGSRRASSASSRGDSIRSQSIDPDGGQRLLVSSPRSRKECVSVTGRQRLDAQPAPDAVHRSTRPTTLKLYAQTD